MLKLRIEPLAALAMILCLAGLAACQGPGKRGAATGDPGTNTDEVSRLEARIIGLTTELDRLGRRVARLEGDPVPEPDFRPPVLPPPDRSEPPALPPPDESPPDPEPNPGPNPEPGIDEVIDRMRAESPRSWSGILIDVRPLGDDAPEGRGYPRWQVTDADGEILFSNDDLAPEFRTTQPVFWVAPAGTRLGPEALPVLGATPYEIQAVSARLIGDLEVRVVVGAEAARELRAYRDMKRLIYSGNIAVLMLKRE